MLVDWLDTNHDLYHNLHHHPFPSRCGFSDCAVIEVLLWVKSIVETIKRSSMHKKRAEITNGSKQTQSTESHSVFLRTSRCAVNHIAILTTSPALARDSFSMFLNVLRKSNPVMSKTSYFRRDRDYIFRKRGHTSSKFDLNLNLNLNLK